MMNTPVFSFFPIIDYDGPIHNFLTCSEFEIEKNSYGIPIYPFFISESHKKHILVVMDLIFNYCKTSNTSEIQIFSEQTYLHTTSFCITK